MTSREDFGRLAYAAYCDMVGRAGVWESLGPRAQAGWIHVATTIRDRLALGMSHGYRPDDRPRAEESAMGLVNKSNRYGGSEDPTITGTDDAELYAAEKARGNEDVQWDGEGPAPDAPNAKPEPEIEETPAESDDGAENSEPERAARPSRGARSKR